MGTIRRPSVELGCGAPTLSPAIAKPRPENIARGKRRRGHGTGRVTGGGDRPIGKHRDKPVHESVMLLDPGGGVDQVFATDAVGRARAGERLEVLDLPGQDLVEELRDGARALDHVGLGTLAPLLDLEPELDAGGGHEREQYREYEGGQLRSDSPPHRHAIPPALDLQAAVYNAPMLRTSPFDLSTLILAGLALTFGLVAYWKRSGLPRISARNALPSLAFPVIAGWLVKLYSHE